MKRETSIIKRAGAALALVAASSAPGWAADPQPNAPTSATTASSGPTPVPTEDLMESTELSSVEQGQAPLTDSFDFDLRRWRLEKRKKALEDTEFRFNLRTMYLDREKYDNTESEAMAAGGWVGFKTGYFLDHIAFGVTGYTSQKLFGDDDKDGTLLLKPGQHGYTVLGEAYADIRIIDGLNLYIGRKEYDTPYINKNDVRMTPNTFEAITLMGNAKFGENGGTLKYGAGYFSKIKERNSDEFVPMSEDAGADIDRGVFTAGATYQKGKFSVGAIDYYSPDIINIFYTEAKVEVPMCGLKPRFALQFTDQRSVGSDALQDDEFSARQIGIKAELPVGPALFTVGYTKAGGDANMQNPWSGYPGYTSVQVEDFNRDGEGALILRAGYDVKAVKGLSAYALWVHGTDPDVEGQFARDEYNFNIQWAPPEGTLKGLSLRLRYSLVDERGSGNDLRDFRAIANYAISF